MKKRTCVLTCLILVTVGAVMLRFPEVENLVSCQSVSVLVELHLASRRVWNNFEHSYFEKMGRTDYKSSLNK